MWYWFSPFRHHILGLLLLFYPHSANLTTSSLGSPHCRPPHRYRQLWLFDRMTSVAVIYRTPIIKCSIKNILHPFALPFSSQRHGIIFHTVNTQLLLHILQYIAIISKNNFSRLYNTFLSRPLWNRALFWSFFLSS